MEESDLIEQVDLQNLNLEPERANVSSEFESVVVSSASPEYIQRITSKEISDENFTSPERIQRISSEKISGEISTSPVHMHRTTSKEISTLPEQMQGIIAEEISTLPNCMQITAEKISNEKSTSSEHMQGITSEKISTSPKYMQLITSENISTSPEHKKRVISEDILESPKRMKSGISEENLSPKHQKNKTLRQTSPGEQKTTAEIRMSPIKRIGQEFLENFFYAIRKSIAEQLRVRYREHLKDRLDNEVEIHHLSSSIDIVEGSELWKEVNKIHSILLLIRQFSTQLEENMFRISMKDEKFNKTILAILLTCEIKNIKEISKELPKDDNKHCMKSRANPEACCKDIFAIMENDNVDERCSKIGEIKDDADKLVKDLVFLSRKYFDKQLHLVAQPENLNLPSTSTAADVPSPQKSIYEIDVDRLRAIHKTGFRDWYSGAFQNIVLYLSQIHYCNLTTQNALLIAKNLGNEQN